MNLIKNQIWKRIIIITLKTRIISKIKIILKIGITLNIKIEWQKHIVVLNFHGSWQITLFIEINLWFFILNPVKIKLKAKGQKLGYDKEWNDLDEKAWVKKNQALYHSNFRWTVLLILWVMVTKHGLDLLVWLLISATHPRCLYQEPRD